MMNTLTDVKVGQEVVVKRYMGSRWMYTFGGIVTKITATGQVTVNYPQRRELKDTRFNANGREIGGSAYYAHYIDADVAGIRASIDEEKVRAQAASAIEAVSVGMERCGTRYGKDTMVEMIATMQARLDAAREAVAKIK